MTEANCSVDRSSLGVTPEPDSTEDSTGGLSEEAQHDLAEENEDEGGGNYRRLPHHRHPHHIHHPGLATMSSSSSSPVKLRHQQQQQQQPHCCAASGTVSATRSASPSSSISTVPSSPASPRSDKQQQQQQMPPSPPQQPRKKSSLNLMMAKSRSKSSLSGGNSRTFAALQYQRRRSQPVTGTLKDPSSYFSFVTRRSSEGSNLVAAVPNGGGKHRDLASAAAAGGSANDENIDEDERKRMSTGYNGPSADWSVDASSISHIFVYTSTSSDSCYLNNGCKHSGSRMKCVACRIIVHEGCIPTLNSTFACRQTFRESIRKYREQTTVEHHWVQRRNLKGKCKHCAKAFQSKIAFGTSSSVIGLSCSWCKYSYHNKDGCLKALENDQVCDLGTSSKVIVPPSWILKLPRKGSFKSSLKSSPGKNKKKRRSSQNAVSETPPLLLDSSCCNGGEGLAEPPPSGNDGPDPPQSSATEGKNVPFCIKPIPNPDVSPILVFLNPKSGGNQGAKLMQKFQWLLNPRQVFDLTQGGPGPAIEMFRRVPNIRLLACGGDGTVGWVLSVLDKIIVDPPPAVGVLPLGTGNDLSRSLGWGGGYIDEPISKILGALATSSTLKMDRWKLTVTRNPDLPSTEEKGEDQLPLNVVNNYFSLGVDAQIALQFHEAREANPQKFNSRIRNKMYYGQAGGKDLLLRKWKDLSDIITVECDGQDITPKLREHRVHSVLFANIPSFGSGTKPWSRAAGEQRIDDRLIEVMGLTTYQLPMLQAGGHATCITQCKSAKIITKKTIPMQVDGEASRLNPATIELTFLNQVVMMAKTKGSSSNHTSSDANGGGPSSSHSRLKLSVSRIGMDDYLKHHHNKEKLKELAQSFGDVDTTPTADLEQVRALVDSLMADNPPRPRRDPDDGGCYEGGNWCFVDTVTAVRFFRIDRAQENLHYVIDICDDNCLYILDEGANCQDEDDIDMNDGQAQQEDLLVAADVGVVPISASEVASGKVGSEAASASLPTAAAAEGHLDKKEDPVGKVETVMTVRQQPPTPKVVEPASLVSRGGSEGPHELLPVQIVEQVREKTTEGILKAARLGDLKMLSELHREGYSLLSIDETGKTALHYGARFGHKEVVKFLIANAPAPILDMVDNEKGQTALHKAAAYKRRTICCMLVAAGASLLVEDAVGRMTPRQLALTAEDTDLAAYLESQEHFQAEKLAGGDPDKVSGEFETPV